MMGNHSTLGELEDTELVILAMIGSIPAFDALILRYRGVLILVAEQVVRRRAIAEEVVQESFLAAFRALPSLDQPAAFPGWLRAICRNQALKTLKQERRCTATDDLDLLVAHESRALSDADWIARIEQEVVGEAIRQLPEDQQEVLYLAAYEDWSVARIAAYLQVPEATVRGRLYRARQAVRRHYHGEETQ